MTNTVAASQASAALGSGTDAYEQLTSSPTYARLSSADRQLVQGVYREVMANASAAFAGIATMSMQAATASAYEAVVDAVTQIQRWPNQDPMRTRPNQREFVLADHPDYVLANICRIKVDSDGDKPHVLVVFGVTSDARGNSIPATRGPFSIASTDMTAANVLAALRKTIGTTHDDVEIRAQSVEDFEAGKKATAADAVIATPPVDESSEARFRRAIAQMNAEGASAFRADIHAISFTLAELSPAIFVESTLTGAAFDAAKASIEERIASWLEAHGFADLVTRAYLPNTILVAERGGSHGL